jgi:integrase
VRKKPGRKGWEGRFPAFDEYGLRIYRWEYFPSEQAARKAALKWESESELQQPVLSSKKSVGWWAELWLKDGLALLEIRASTVDLYRTLAEQHVVTSRFAKIPLRDVTPYRIKVFLTELKGKGLAVSTIRTIHTVLNHIFGIAIDKRELVNNPLRDAPRPKETKKEQVRLLPEEISAILGAAKSSRFFYAIVFMVLLGLRRGEALAMHWHDVDFNGGKIHVRGTLERSRGFEEKASLKIGPPKTVNALRTITASDAVFVVLRKAKAQQAEERLRAGSLWEDEGLVFPTSYGKKCDPRNLYRAVRRASEICGVLEGRPHLFRHGAISQILEGGYLPDYKLSRTMGHSSVAITTETYGHYKPLGEKEALDRWAEDLGIA